MKSKRIALLALSTALVATLAVPAVAVAAQSGAASSERHCMFQGERVACVLAGETGKAAQRIRACVGQLVGGVNFVDADGDGVCDNRGDGACAGFVDSDGDGVCDNYANGACAGAGFVDADGDGVCDNRGDGACGNREASHHAGRGGQQRHGCM